MPAFIPNPGFPDDFLAEDATREGLVAVAEGIRPLVEQNVRSARGPWMPNKEGKPPVEVVEAEDGVYVSLTDHAGHLMELGSANYPPHAPLRRAASAAGMRTQS